MKLGIHVIDAFTSETFKGNSAAVIITDNWLLPSLMQDIASENNLSETAFVVKNSNNEYDIRWFSPLTEIDFCGHATLASAYVLFEQNVMEQQLTFRAKAVGSLSVIKCANGYMQMSFPNRIPTSIHEIPDELLRGLSIAPIKVLRNEQAYFAIYESEQDIAILEIDVEQIKRLAPFDVVATAPSDAANYEIDFVSRYFWPANGGVEDPVTGSIHAGLTPFWASELNKAALNAYQASARGGYLKCEINDDRVLISGQAKRYLSGIIEV
jgi:PhzF family phenazine biosynthesis protein